MQRCPIKVMMRSRERIEPVIIVCTPEVPSQEVRGSNRSPVLADDAPRIVTRIPDRHGRVEHRKSSAVVKKARGSDRGRETASAGVRSILRWLRARSRQKDECYPRIGDAYINGPRLL